MAVTNPLHLSDGHRMRVWTRTRPAPFVADLGFNDIRESVLWFEITEGYSVPIPYSDFMQATVFLSSYAEDDGRTR